ncbi:MAG: hypothetical protein ABJR46_00545 [Tateyamaria sp.]|uniref:tetratricopeptide repeat protein n=1 Tax=Tateyamaria sp. TaxID=1929288 RepID=UPI00329B2477
MRSSRWWLAASIALLSALPALPSGTEIDIATAKKLAVGLANQGQPKAALAILAELAKHRADDPEIYIALSRTHRTLGDTKQAIKDARQGFALSQTKTHKHLTARVMAEALASDGQHTRAQFWLRRAGQTAPNEVAKALVRRDYGYVRSRNPWAFSFRGSVTPTNNANDAPTSDEIVIGGNVFRDPTAQPISGIEYVFGATARYRFPATVKRQSELRFSYDGRRVDLDSEANEIDPDIENRDFSFDRVTVEWAHKFRNPDSKTKGVYDLSFGAFFDWHGGGRSQDGLRARGGYTVPVNERNTVRFGFEIEDLDRRDRPIRSSNTYRASVDWFHTRASADRLNLHLSYADTNSDSSAVAHDSVRLSAQYSFSKPVMTAHISLGVDLRNSTFDNALFGPDPRDDNALGLSATATLPRLGVYGFAPVLELRRDRVFSNVPRFDKQTTQLSLSFRSTY